MHTHSSEHSDAEVKAILIPDPDIKDIDMLQQRFGGQLNVLRLKSGQAAIYPEPQVQNEFEKFRIALMTFQTQAIDLRRAA